MNIFQNVLITNLIALLIILLYYGSIRLLALGVRILRHEVLLNFHVNAHLTSVVSYDLIKMAKKKAVS